MGIRMWLVLCLFGVSSGHLKYNSIDIDSPETEESKTAFPVVITTWDFLEANSKAWETIQHGSAVDAVEKGGTVCEELQCHTTVGFGGSPDENGETTLDAMIMDGVTMNMGAVGALRRIKGAISVARHVMEYTSHSLLAGDQATKFAVEMGFKEEPLSSSVSKNLWKKWRDNNCQPNFWINVTPDPKTQCGPYKTKSTSKIQPIASAYVDGQNHDTIGLVAIDKKGHIAAGTSTNGANHKLPGRVGDSPIPGAGAYADQDVGGAAATGDGDIMMRFLPSYHAVEEMRRGMSPQRAAQSAIQRIVAKYPDFRGAIVVLRKDGTWGTSCHNFKDSPFPFVVSNTELGKATLLHSKCV